MKPFLIVGRFLVWRTSLRNPEEIPKEVYIPENKISVAARPQLYTTVN
jgi:hypothetical protein